MTAPVAMPDKAHTTPTIEIRGLTKEFGRVPVLWGLDLDVQAGSTVAVVGARGAGKTTLLSIVAGLLRPTCGEVRICGLDATRDAARLRKRIGVLLQAPRFYGWLTGRETLQFCARFSSLNSCRFDRRADEVLAFVDLFGVADDRVETYSAGMRRRLGIAQALLGSPDLLLLDEPGMLLDAAERSDVFRLLQRLQGSATILFTTDEPQDAGHVADEVAVLRRGRSLTPVR